MAEDLRINIVADGTDKIDSLIAKLRDTKISISDLQKVVIESSKYYRENSDTSGKLSGDMLFLAGNITLAKDRLKEANLELLDSQQRLRAFGGSTEPIESVSEKIRRLTADLERGKLSITQTEKAERELESAIKSQATVIDMEMNLYKNEIEVLKRSKDMRTEATMSLLSEQGRIKKAYFEVGLIQREQNAHTITARTSLLSMAQVMQDMPYGIRGVGNNVEQLTQQMSYLVSQTGSVKEAMNVLVASFTGATGILFIISAAISAWTMYDMALERSNKKSKEAAKDGFEDLRRKMKEMSDIQFMVSSGDVKKTLDDALAQLMEARKSGTGVKDAEEYYRTSKATYDEYKKYADERAKELHTTSFIKIKENEITDLKKRQLEINIADKDGRKASLLLSDEIEKKEKELTKFRMSSSDIAKENLKIIEAQNAETNRLRKAMEDIQKLADKDVGEYERAVVKLFPNSSLTTAIRLLEITKEINQFGMDAFSRMQKEERERRSLVPHDFSAKGLDKRDSVREGLSKKSDYDIIKDENKGLMMGIDVLKSGFSSLGRTIHMRFIDEMMQSKNAFESFVGGVLSGLEQIAMKLASTAVMSSLLSVFGLGSFGSFFGGLSGLGASSGGSDLSGRTSPMAYSGSITQPQSVNLSGTFKLSGRDLIAGVKLNRVIDRKLGGNF